MKSPIGIYIDVNGIVHEVFIDQQNIEFKQMEGFVQVDIIEKNENETEIVESYVLHKIVKTLKEITS